MGSSSQQPHDSLPNVLIVDDSPDVHRLLRARLRDLNVNFINAHNGSEAMEMAKELNPAIILLDLDMPDIDGFEVLRKLKDDGSTVNIPVIVISGLHATEDKVTAFDLGVIDYITKPFELSELRARVRSALRIQMLLNMLSERAHVDGLTGLWNRSHFDSRWEEEVAASLRHSRPLSLAIIDIDHFKSINDIFGHPVGDVTLQTVAKVVQSCSRETDIACRYGGEEFVIIMPETPPDAAVKLCDRIRNTLESLTWPQMPERVVTASVGVAGCKSTPKLDALEWIALADQCLYRSKEGGRNKTTFAQVDEASAPRLADAG
ncbi:MAG: diguanylate cyclase [Phycisphaeraceae bacterium]|nr:diguanylate cyclase [Phycisphaerales bacterium]MCB9861576.1 diguanylate cyclase [Phycisphaeraceae bacterium]